MRRKLIYALMWFYVRLVRPWTSAFLFKFLTRHIDPRTGLWQEYKNLPAKQFENKLKQVAYTGDPLMGLIDYTITDPDYFWTPGIPDVDCDDIAYMWYLWAKENGYEVWLCAIMDGWHLRSAHSFVIFRDGDVFILCNYTMDLPRKTFSECVNQFERHILVEWGQYKDLILIVDKHEDERE